jgi:UDP-glucose 4-epimerase
MKCLITGGAGFIGSHLVDRLIKDGHTIAIIDNLSTGKKENLNKKANFYKIDICNAKIREIFKKEKPEIVFHLAAQIDVRKSVQNPIEDAQINILGSLNILENCKEFGVKKIIFISSGGAIYGEAKIVPTPESYPANPLSPYGIAKLAIEKYLNYYYEVFNLPFISLRLANVYGPRQNPKGEAGVVAIFTDKLLNNQIPVINGDGTQTRDYVFVNDVVDAAILAFKSLKLRKPIFNIGTGMETSVNDLYKIMTKKIEKNISADHNLAKIGEQERSCLNYSKVAKELNWQPKYNIERGIKMTIDWFRTHEY